MKFGWRLTWLGATFLVMLAVLVVRLWYVQVAAGEFYAAQVATNVVDVRSNSAPRGMIVDRNGEVVARSRFEMGVLVDRRQIPVEEEAEVMQVLAAFLDKSPTEVTQIFEHEGSGARFVIGTVDQDTAVRLLERSPNLPGVSIEEVPIRVYELGGTGKLMAHIIGYVGLPSSQDIAANPDLDRQTVVGRAGVEHQYDDFLRGTQGYTVYRVDGDGDGLYEFRREPAHPGATVVLTIDSETQLVVEEALAEGISLGRRVTIEENLDRIENNETVRALPDKGAAVVLDVNDFSVLAMASFPAYAPEDFVGGIDPAEFSSLLAAEAFNNLVIQAQVPPASTFKAVTYVTALEEGLFPARATTNSDDGTILCSGQLVADFTDGSTRGWNDWLPSGHGIQDIHSALAQSCNIYFWEVALRIWDEFKTTDGENIIQDYARDFGFGSPTGIDLPFEKAGIVPDRALFQQWARDGDPRLDPNRIQPGQSVFYGGDLLQLVVGQGAMIATPIQLATAYASMVNGGTVGVPHVVSELLDLEGNVIESLTLRIVRQLDLDPQTVRFLLEDLTAVINGGTARVAFEDFGPGLERIGGKTGTAQVGRNVNNHAWFVGVVPTDDPQYVVVVYVDQGGSGGRVAAPVAKRIMQHLMGVDPTPISAGEDTD